MERPEPKYARPETLSQARTWDTVRNHYLQDGFCEKCSAQAAWGHQIGFSRIKDVCENCVGIIPTYNRAGERAYAWANVETGD